MVIIQIARFATRTSRTGKPQITQACPCLARTSRDLTHRTSSTPFACILRPSIPLWPTTSPSPLEMCCRPWTAPVRQESCSLMGAPGWLQSTPSPEVGMRHFNPRFMTLFPLHRIPGRYVFVVIPLWNHPQHNSTQNMIFSVRYTKYEHYTKYHYI